MREGTENGQQQQGGLVTMVKGRRGNRGEVGVGGVHTKKEQVEGDNRTLCSHTNARVRTHTNRHAQSRLQTQTLCVHMKAHKQF